MKNSTCILLISILFIFSHTTFGQTKKKRTEESTIQLENAFITLDSVWIPGKRQIYPLHYYSSYLWLDNNTATISTQGRANIYGRGPIRGVKVSDDEQGFRTVYFYIPADQISVEMKEIGNDKFEIHIYKPLGSEDFKFIGRYIDPSRVEEIDMYFH
jgi:hypothetical protein